MNENELEEFRYDVVTELLKDTNATLQYHLAHDKLSDMLSNKTEQELRDMIPEKKKNKKSKRSKHKKGF
jgi:hypothetical protein